MRRAASLALVAAIATSAAGAQNMLLPGEFQRGVNYVHVRHQGYATTVSRNEMKVLKKLGVTSLALIPQGFQDGATAEAIVGYDPGKIKEKFYSQSDPTLTDQDLAKEIDTAHKLGFSVTLKPQLVATEFWGGRRTPDMITQPDAETHREWWNSYSAFIVHYARLAQTSHAEMLCIGTGLVQMTRPIYADDWRRLIQQIRGVYRGPIIYAAAWDTEFEQINFWDSLDFIGLNAFVPLDASTGASSTELATLWKTPRQRMEALSNRFKKPILFMEAGYRPVADCYQHPAESEGGTPDLLAQARAYDALFLAFRDAAWWKGIYLYRAYTNPDSEDPDEFAFRHRPAEKVIERWFGRAEEKKGTL